MEGLAGRIILLWGWRRALVAFLSGALFVLAQAPFDFPAAAFVSFPMLVWLLDGANGRPADGFLRRRMPSFAAGWWFGFGYFLAGLWWIGGAVLVEAESFAWALPFAVVGIPLVLSFFYGFATMLARILWTDGVGRIFALAFGFGVAEWLRGFLLTGFPWNPAGFAAMPVPMLMQSAKIFGVTGMNVLAVLVFAMPALLAAGPGRRSGFAIAGILLALHAGYGYVSLFAPAPAEGKRLAVRIVQPSIDLSEKWDAGVRDRIFATMLALSSEVVQGAEKPQLIVWPETSVPFLLTERPDALAAIGGMLGEGQMLLAGAVREEAGASAADDARYYNSVVLIDASGAIVDAMDKVHLVPFGEYLPFEDLMARLGVGQLVAGPMNFDAGSERRAMSLPGGLRAVAYICYEIIFPDLVAAPAGEADLLVNVTNDAWFGDTPGPYQHLRQAQLRAVETGRPLLRAANTGISALVDDRGRIVDALAMDARGVIDASLIFPQQNTPPASGKAGFAAIAVLALCATFLNVRRRLRGI